ncbi:MAG: hypothetical protein HY741_29800 [Chloroflexi bacterium]|nr:hypothetical protein [Chloroflexota bacterium]
MKCWLIFLALLSVTACSSPPTPTPTPTSPPATLIATVVPIPTLLPTVTIPAPTQPPASATPEPTATRRTTTNVQPPTRFNAPALLAPQPPTLFKDGNDIKFTYAAVGKLEPNQCYLLHVELAVPNLEKGNRGDDFLDTANCGDPGPTGKELSFVLYRGKFTNSPNYGTILAQTLALAPEARQLKLTWLVRVVQNNGRAADGVHYRTVPLSPNSPVIELEFQP